MSWPMFISMSVSIKKKRNVPASKYATKCTGQEVVCRVKLNSHLDDKEKKTRADDIFYIWVIS